MKSSICSLVVALCLTQLVIAQRAADKNSVEGNLIWPRFSHIKEPLEITSRFKRQTDGLSSLTSTLDGSNSITSTGGSGGSSGCCCRACGGSGGGSGGGRGGGIGLVNALLSELVSRRGGFNNGAFDNGALTDFIIGLI